MATIKDHTITVFISIILVILLYDKNVQFLNIWLFHGLLNILLCIVCYVFTNPKYFSLTISKLSKYDRYEALEYKFLYNKNIISNIYVRPTSSRIWYELYYPLTIDRKCTYAEAEDFSSSHRQVMSLLRTMRANAYKSDYNDWRRVLTLLGFWLFEIYYWLMVLNIIWLCY